MIEWQWRGGCETVGKSGTARFEWCSLGILKMIFERVAIDCGKKKNVTGEKKKKKHKKCGFGR
jgi:hypothetical protein